MNKAVAEMDKVVQQDSAGAEESASASEQMSAQTGIMKQMVAELVALIGKKTASSGTEAAPVRPLPPKGRARRQAQVRSVNTASPPRRSEIPPEQVIPMQNDKDFEDF